jgi:hypothetical protein
MANGGTTPAVEDVPPQPVVVSADDTGLVLEWSAPDFAPKIVIGDDALSYVALETPGWLQASAPGQPQLPAASALAVAPPDGDVTLNVQVLQRSRYALAYPIVPASEPVVVGEYPFTAIQWAWARDGQAYGEGLGQYSRTTNPCSLGAAEYVTLEEAGWQRGRRLMRLTFSPFCFAPARLGVHGFEGPSLEVASRVRVELRFEGRDLQTGRWSATDPFIPLLQQTVVNPDQVLSLARPERPDSGQDGVSMRPAAPQADQRYRLLVSTEGVYQLTYEDLVLAGVPIGTDYRMEHAGGEIAYQWDDDGDTTIEPGERILFYARPTLSRFSDHDVYWLIVGGSGTEMDVRSGDPDALTIGTAWTTALAAERNHYLPQYPAGRDGDRWYWDRLYWDYVTGTGERDKQFEVELAVPESGASDATLRVYLQGTTSNSAVNPDHRVRVWLNGTLLGATEWDGVAYHTGTFLAPASILQAGTNTVRMRLPGTGASTGVEESWVDGVEIYYGIDQVLSGEVRVDGEAGQNQYTVDGFTSGVRLYDVTEPALPQVVTPFVEGGSSVTFGDVYTDTDTYYLLTEDQISAPDEILRGLTLDDPPSGADYLIISHADFITSVAPLADYRATSDGLRVFSATAQAIYDVYSGGVVSPLAISGYISHAYHTWTTPTLSYVLLVGDGVKEGSSQHIPPYLIIDPWDPLALAEVPSDNQYVTMDGPGDQDADMFIGRLPASTVTETEIIVTKILSYEVAPPQWPWNERVLFFTDDDLQFRNDSDSVYYGGYIPGQFTGHRAYYCDTGCGASHLYNDILDARAAILDLLGFGGVVASYVGHSSFHQWAVSPQGVPMLHRDHVPSLQSGQALPVILELTCYTSDFADLGGDTLDESFLCLEDGGAVATWGPTTQGLTGGHRILHNEFIRAVFDLGYLGLGEATEWAKDNPSLEPLYSDLRDTFILFGDPAMELNLTIVPWSDEMFLPLTLRNSS